MGTAGRETSEEDTLCATYLKQSLEQGASDFSAIVSRLKDCPSARKFFDPAKDWAPARDFELCVSLNRFDFVLKAEPYAHDLVFLRRTVGKGARR